MHPAVLGPSRGGGRSIPPPLSNRSAEGLVVGVKLGYVVGLVKGDHPTRLHERDGFTEYLRRLGDVDKNETSGCHVENWSDCAP